MLRAVVLLSIVLVQASAQNAVTPKDCTKVDMTLHTKKCCQKPVGDLATADHLKMCNNKDKTLNLWINNYMMHKLQNAKNQQVLDMTSPNNAKLVCKVANFINCVFNYHKIMDNATYTIYNGTAAMAIINKTIPNRGDWYNQLEIVEYDDIPAIIAESWNRSISCPDLVKKNEAPKSVYLGNLYLMQYFHVHLAMSCPSVVVPDTKNKCATHESNFFACLEKVQEALQSKKTIQLPNWMKNLNEKETRVLKTHMQLLRSKFA